MQRSTGPLIPLTYDPLSSATRKPAHGPITRTYLFLRRRRPITLVLSLFLFLVFICNLSSLSTFRRDLVYLLRPIWDTPEPPFHIIPHYPAPITGKPAWCALHHFHSRSPGSARPIVVDAIPIATELDMLEIRIREYLPFVTIFVIVEATLTHAGQEKPLHFHAQRERFESIVREAGTGATIVYGMISEKEGLVKDLPKGSFNNEIKQRSFIDSLLKQQREKGAIPPGSLVIQSDVDEIISRDTLDLLTSCGGFPSILHLNVANYLYSYNQPLRDQGYWRPKIVTVPSDLHEDIHYNHARSGDTLLADAGWHCSFCFPTLEDMRRKMSGYVHNDRLRSPDLLEEDNLRRRVCSGQDPFNMWPEAFTYKDLAAQSGGIRPENSFRNMPLALQQYPDRFGYLLGQGCDRPDT